jgi:transcriptional activator SPT7
MSQTPQRPLPNGLHRAVPAYNARPRRANSLTRDASIAASLGAPAQPGEDEEREDDPIHTMLKARCAQTEMNIAALFAPGGQRARSARSSPSRDRGSAEATRPEDSAKPSAPPKKAARTIEDDYGDDDEEDEEEESEQQSPLKSKGKAATTNGVSAPAVRSPMPPIVRTNTNTSSEQAKSSEDVRKQLDEDKRAAAENAKRAFQEMFFTFENDRAAMLEQQKLDELDREVENEISGDPNASPNAQVTSAPVATTQGTLGSADLGASSLTLKHLIARIDMKRDMVRASDNQLRTLISEVRKGRSKWASEDRVGQEELYEAAEKVLMELKARTDYVQPFLQRVSKREAPDYYNVIKTPMDIGTMIKKLKQFAYKSKAEFVEDLYLIWNNCLKYNISPELAIRRKALHMRKETDKLVPLIPEIIVRDRAEVEAEERRARAGEEDESDEDDAPIMASRGRKAPKKGGKSGPSAAARKAPPSVEVDDQSMSQPDAKPLLHGAASNLRNEYLRADSEAHDASSAGFNTPPPPGRGTPGLNGIHASGAHGSQADVMEIDGFGGSGLSLHHEDADEDDADFKTWKQVTMKDRAAAAAERNRLFRGESLNPEETAILRSKVGMRRWMRQQKMSADKVSQDTGGGAGEDDFGGSATGETLAEGIEKDEDSTLPDYYNPLSSIPDMKTKWDWTTDSEGHVVPQTEAYMRMFPRQTFKTPHGALADRMEGNIRQMQDTRKVCAKIGIVKQMQIQAQTYQNQFQKYDPEPFAEADIGPVVVSEDGPLMAPWVCRAALKRSVGKLFYHAGFEDFQPSALESVTDVAGEYFRKLAENFNCFREQPKAEADAPRYTQEEQVLHSLHENGVDLEGLETYVKDDVERLTTKLGVVHERMKAHLADLLVSNTHKLTLRDYHRLHFNSDQPLVTTQVQTASVPSTMEASNLSVVTLPKTSAKTSLASKNSVWLTNSAWTVSAYPCIFSRTVCTAATKRRTKGRSPRAARSSPRRLPTTQLASNIYPTTLAWCKTTSGRSYARTTTKRWSKTKTCHRSSASPNLACRPLAKSRPRANVRFANSNRRPRRSASWRKTPNSICLWASSNYRCQSRGTTATNRRKSTATSTAP